MGRLANWGATASEIQAALPGDERVSRPSDVSTRAVTIRARPADVWPWLAQMGYRRGGLYSYDWLDRLFGYLDRPSAEEILPEYQSIKAGDTIPLGRGLDWPVVEVDPQRTLVLEPIKGMVTWSFVLGRIGDGTTRLITRVRFRAGPSLKDRWMMAVMNPAAFVMTRKMLLGIKRRAEALARRRSAPARLVTKRVTPSQQARGSSRSRGPRSMAQR